MEASRSTLELNGVRANGVHAETDLELLLCQILERVREEGIVSAAVGESSSTQQVVLDVDVDGSHYTLIRSAPDLSQPHVTLSPREREIVRLIAKGLPNKAIAAVLDISLWTVATYIRRLFAKFGVGSRAELIARVMKEGLLGSPE